MEFALLVPMLLVLFLGIADFGRVFAAGISVEAAARNAAEAAAQDYLRAPPAPMDQPPPPANEAYYEKLHEMAARTACREARLLPETTYQDGDLCRWTAAHGNPAEDVPVIAVCVHDGVDPLCGDIAFGATPPDECTILHEPMDPAMEGGTEESRYVEVRICYRFSTIINIRDLSLPFGWGISIGDVYLQKQRVFAVGYYPPPPTPEPPPQPPQPPDG
ncbi:MAG TPA: TadE family protein, partial [Candidatus Limnocylindrales bacterium]|nr:TadE family protein [Candidatus Limnocylindrales bacterium]